MHLIDSDGYYGAERVVLTLAREHCAVGHDVVIGTIVAPQDKGNALAEAAQRCSVAWHEFRMKDGFNLRGLRSILRYARERGVDVIHSHGYKANILLGVTPKRLRPPVVATLHGWTNHGNSWSRMRLYEGVECFLLERVEAVVAVSAAMREDARLRKVVDRVAVIPNGISLGREGEPPPEGDDVLDFIRGRPCLVYAGRLSPEKGVDLLIDAMPSVLDRSTDLRLVLFGDGPEAETLRRQVRSLGITSNVLFAGYRTNVRAYLRYFDALVLPSRTEGLPLVLLEAMAAGVAVIASPVGAIPWVLQDGDCGVLLSEVGRAEAVAGGIVAVILDRELRERVRAAAARRVEREFDAVKCAARYERLYERLQGRSADI